MAPMVNLIVYYIQGKGEIVYDQLKFHLAPSSLNEVIYFYGFLNLMLWKDIRLCF